MHYSVERHLKSVIQPGAFVAFDHEVDSSLSLTVPLTEVDFKRAENHTQIKFYKAGYYVVKYRTNQLTGMSADGEFFELFKKDYFNPEYEFTPDEEVPWVPLSNGDMLLSDAKAIPIIVPEEEVSYWYDPNDVSRTPFPVEPRTFTIGLRNVSGKVVKLSPFSQVKVSLLIFGVPHLVIDREEVEDLRIAMDQYTIDYTVADLIPRRDRSDTINQMQNTLLHLLPDPAPEPLPDPLPFPNRLLQFYETYTAYFTPKPEISCASVIPGLTIHVNVTGYVHAFTVSGAIDVGQTTSNKVMLLDAEDYPPLKSYQGGATIAPCHYSIAGSIDIWMPVYFDSSGIYLVHPLQEALEEGCVYSFNQSLILG